MFFQVVFDGNPKFCFTHAVLYLDHKIAFKSVEPCPYVLYGTFWNKKRIFFIFLWVFVGVYSLLFHDNISLMPFLQILRFFVNLAINLAVLKGSRL